MSAVPVAVQVQTQSVEHPNSDEDAPTVTDSVLDFCDEKYRYAARETQAAILQVDGLPRAAVIIDNALKIGAAMLADA